MTETTWNNSCQRRRTEQDWSHLATTEFFKLTNFFFGHVEVSFAYFGLANEVINHFNNICIGFVVCHLLLAWLVKGQSDRKRHRADIWILPDCIFSIILQSRILEVTVVPRSFGSLLWGKSELQGMQQGNYLAVSRQPFAGETPELFVLELPLIPKSA